MNHGESYIEQLAEYIKKNLKKGYTKDSLRWALINQGHSKIEVEKAIKYADEHLSQKAPVMKARPEIKYEVIEPKNAIIKKKSFWKKLLGR
ncbi:hypothetical protein COU54_05420 [Candidatus Pacearchaeota archaeon CG10_big_fil_rev_8_21_14_0_10_31_24]|nr:MAG: hypothetical protein COU54_05420 [Candidatus Pacearchaeota archaeon CG10_big_fil_rev_8_21_14_0_10_31_24]